MILWLVIILLVGFGVASIPALTVPTIVILLGFWLYARSRRGKVKV